MQCSQWIVESFRVYTHVWSVAGELWRRSNKLRPGDSQDPSPIQYRTIGGEAALQDARSSIRDICGRQVDPKENYHVVGSRKDNLGKFRCFDVSMLLDEINSFVHSDFLLGRRCS
jgi:hypothetical protein